MMRTGSLVRLILDEMDRQDRLYPHQPGALSPMEWGAVVAQEGLELLEQLAAHLKRVQQAAAAHQGHRTKPPDDLLKESIQAAATIFRLVRECHLLDQEPAA